MKLSNYSPAYLRWRADAFKQEAAAREVKGDPDAHSLRGSAFRFLEQATYLEYTRNKENAHG